LEGADYGVKLLIDPGWACPATRVAFWSIGNPAERPDDFARRTPACRGRGADPSFQYPRLALLPIGLAHPSDTRPSAYCQRANNPNGCFNWFQAGDIERGHGEACSIRQMVDTMVSGRGIVVVRGPATAGKAPLRAAAVWR